MEVFEQLKQLIKSKDKQRIVFPEGDDVRILTAVSQLKKDDLLEPIVLGKKDQVLALAKENDLDLSGVMIIDPVTSPDFEIGRAHV